MATKKRTTRKSSTSKAKNTKKSQIEKIEKNKGNQSKRDGRRNNGGARDGAGRKPNEDRERLNTLKDMAELHALEEVGVKITTAQGIKEVKKTRAGALLDVLFSEGLKNKNIPAIKEYFDRTRGKATQPVEHSGEIKTEDQYVPTDPALKKAHEVYIKETKKLIAQGYYESTDWDDEE